MGRFTKSIFKNENFSLSECTDGFYLYDHSENMNICMYAKTEQAAFVESLTYYQKKLKRVQSDYEELNSKVESFLSLFPRDED